MCAFYNDRSTQEPPMHKCISLEAQAQAAIARTSFFVLYSVFKEHQVEGAHASELDREPLLGVPPERCPPADSAGCFTCSRGPDERGLAV